jgi:hypothetical protein
MAITFPLVQEQQKSSGTDCPGLSIITALCWTLSLAELNKVQDLQVSSTSPDTKRYQITFAVFVSL